MTEVTTWDQSLAVVARELTYDETADLDRLRAVLATATDRTDARAVSWLWDSMLDAHRGQPAPAGFVEAVATALGDLLAVHVPTARWAVWPGPLGDPTLGVASDARPHAPVVPFLDARDCWTAGSRGWVVDYLARADAHLRGTPLPRPRRSLDDHVAPPAAAPAPEPAPVAPAVVAPVVVAPAAEPAPLPVRVPASGPLPMRATTPPAPEVPVPVVMPAPPAAAGPLFTAGPAPAPLVVAAPEESRRPQEPPVRRDDAPAVAGAGVPLQEFALDALDHAMTLLRETGAFDREVFVLLLDGSGRHTESCTGDAAEARARAGEVVRASRATRAAVTWVERDSATLPGPRQGFPAVLVDAWDAGTDGVRVGRRFVDDVLGTGPLGAPLVVGPVAPLL